MNIFTLTDDDHVSDKMNLDDLFEKKREISESKLQLYTKILNRIHVKIKMTSRQQQGKEQFCWYTIPEIMIGVARYNVEECRAYIIRKLKDNNFAIRYTHPNLIFISWQHWVPGYVRQEYKKQTGQTIDGFGNFVTDSPKITNGDTISSSDPNNLIFKSSDKIKINKEKDKDFNSTKNYKPTGIYNNDLLKKIQDKFNV